MKEIPVGELVAFVDDEDYERLSRLRWYLNAGGYACARRRGANYLMHRLVMNAPRWLLVDHRNGIRLDNRKSELRLASRRENGLNRRPARWPIHFSKRRRAWLLRFCRNGRAFRGEFATFDAAVAAYERQLSDLDGRFAWTKRASVSLPCEMDPALVQHLAILSDLSRAAPSNSGLMADLLISQVSMRLAEKYDSGPCYLGLQKLLV